MFEARMFFGVNDPYEGSALELSRQRKEPVSERTEH
jgi:hypothetical protein